MPNLLEELQALLAQDERLVAEDGNLLKNLVVELGLKLDADLIRLLLSNDPVRRHFFTEVDEVLAFDKVKFLQFVSNKEFLPDSYTSFKNKIGLSDDGGETYISRRGDVALVWPYKDCVLEGGQAKKDARRDEVFWNQTLAPDEVDRLLDSKVLCNFRRVDLEGEHPVEQIRPSDNFIIQGNNLLVLSSLNRRLGGQVKLIYVDPPFNTESDSFRYNDKFNHSTWLTFMKNRLSAAKKLLKANGTFLVHSSSHEYPYLKVLMDELMEKYLCTFHLKVRHPERILTGDKEYNDIIEYVLVYTENQEIGLPKIEEKKTNEDYVYTVEELDEGEKLVMGKKTVHVYTPDSYTVSKTAPSADNLKKISVRGSIREKNSSGRFYVKHLEDLEDQYPPNTLFKVPGIGDDKLDYRYFYLPPEGNINGGYYQGKPQSSSTTLKPYPNFFDYEPQYNSVADEGGVGFRNGKKPEELLAFLIDIFTEEDDIVLDYFLGSGTTAAVAHKMGRRYVGIEQLDYIEDITIQRLKNVVSGDQTGVSRDLDWQGGGDFIVCELMKWNEKYVSLIQDASTPKELWGLWQQMQEEAFLSYRVDIAAVNKNATSFEQLTLDEQKHFLLETLDHNALYVNLSEIDDADYDVSEHDKALNSEFYGGDL